MTKTLRVLGLGRVPTAPPAVTTRPSGTIGSRRRRDRASRATRTALATLGSLDLTGPFSISPYGLA